MLKFFLSLCLLLTALIFISSLSLETGSSFEVFSSYECGFEPLRTNHIPFCMKFFLLAIIFVVFDVEIAFLMPSLFKSSLMLTFTLILLLGLIFEYSYGGLS